MRDLRRTSVVLLLVLAAASTACTGKKSVPPAPVSASASGEGPVTTNEDVRFKPGEYEYSFNNITVAMTFDGSAATLDVTNHSGAEVGAPGLYAITGDDQRYDATVDGAAPVADGASVSFKVTFPDNVTAQTAGLVVLLLGQDNMGALAPVPVGSPSPSA